MGASQKEPQRLSLSVQGAVTGASPQPLTSSRQHLWAWGLLLRTGDPLPPVWQAETWRLALPGSRLGRTPAVSPLGWGLCTSPQDSRLPTVGVSHGGGGSDHNHMIKRLLSLFSPPYTAGLHLPRATGARRILIPGLPRPGIPV